MGRPSRYDPALRKTEHGVQLYTLWRKIRMNPHCAEFNLFPDFYNWAMQSGYELGMWLLRINGEKPFSPDNCEWYTPGERDNSEWINNWNKSVNRIRKYYGMPPLEGTDYGD